jgi:hypothetical protein
VEAEAGTTEAGHTNAKRSLRKKPTPGTSIQSVDTFFWSHNIIHHAAISTMALAILNVVNRGELYRSTSCI